jgi:hypothetical protein
MTSTKFQINFNYQNSKLGKGMGIWTLGLGIYLGFGIWDLGFAT